MTADGRGSLAGLLWLIAFSAMALAAVLSPADVGGVIGLVAVGHLLWGLAFVMDREVTARSEPVVRGQRYVVGMFVAAGAFDVLGLIVASVVHDGVLALWLELALSFVAVGIANTRRQAPGDGVLSIQIFFHTLMALAPAVALLNVALGVDSGVFSRTPGDGFLDHHWMCYLVAANIPFLLPGLIIAILHNFMRPVAERKFIWSALMAHQAAYLVIALRWLVS